MEAHVRLGKSQTVQEFWSSQPIKDRETQALYPTARGRCFNVAFAARPTAISCLVFRNFYAASLRLVQLNIDGTTTVLLEDYPLMSHAHCEDDAQRWHLIRLDKLRARPDVLRLDSLQFYIFQPSTLFDKCALEHLKLYESPHKDGGIVEDKRAPVASPTRVPSLPQPTRRLSRSSLAIVDGRDVREHATQTLSLVHELRSLLYGGTTP